MKFSERFNGYSKFRGGMIVLLVSALLVELAMVAIIAYAKEVMQNDVSAFANIELQLANKEITDLLSDVQCSAACMVWSLERNLDKPDSVYQVLRGLLDNEPSVINCGVFFRENYYAEYGRWFEPLASRGVDGSISVHQVGGEDHDYLDMKLFKGVMSRGTDSWSEPYRNVVGREDMVVSYAYPVRDADGSMAGVLCADISLEWLSAFSKRKPLTPSSGLMMLSGRGRIILYPYDENMVLTKKVVELDDDVPVSVHEMHQRMLSGESGEMEVEGHDGKTWLAFYCPVTFTRIGEQYDLAQTGWSMAILCPKSEIYAPLHRMQKMVMIFMLLSIALLAFIVVRSIRNIIKLNGAMAERNRLDGELRAASVIQRGMLPMAKLNNVHGVSVSASLTPAKAVGGDLYDYFERDGKLFFCIGDVSGKGIPAALLMSVTRTLFRNVASREDDPQKIVEMMNDNLVQMDEQSMFVTFFLGVLDVVSGVLRYCNAGHEVPIVISSDAVRSLDVVANLPLGAWEGYQYVGQNTQLPSGSVLFLYTDGLTEAMNEAHEQLRISAVLAECELWKNRCDGDGLLDAMKVLVLDFAGEAVQSDDLTMLTVTYNQQNK